MQAQDARSRSLQPELELTVSIAAPRNSGVDGRVNHPYPSLVQKWRGESGLATREYPYPWVRARARREETNDRQMAR